MGSSVSQQLVSPCHSTVKVDNCGQGVTFNCEYTGESGHTASIHATRSAIVGAALVDRPATSFILIRKSNQEGCCWSTCFITRLVSWLCGWESEKIDKEEEDKEELEDCCTKGMTSVTAISRLGDYVTLFSPSWSADDIRLQMANHSFVFGDAEQWFVIGDKDFSNEEECEQIARAARPYKRKPTDLEIIINYYDGGDDCIEWMNANDTDVEKAIDALVALEDTTVFDMRDTDDSEESDEVEDEEENESAGQRGEAAEELSDDAN